MKRESRNLYLMVPNVQEAIDNKIGNQMRKRVNC